MEDQKIDLLKNNLYFLDKDINLQKEIVQQHERVRERALDHVYKILQVVGLVAGFGFTAISFVYNLNLFLIGEFILFFNIAFGIFWIRKTFIDEAGKYKEWISQLGKIIDARMKVSPQDDLKTIQEKIAILKTNSIELAKDMGKGNKDEDMTQENKKHSGATVLQFLAFLFMLGGIIILVSFLEI